MAINDQFLNGSLKSQLVVDTIDLTMLQFYNAGEFSYEDYEKATCRVNVYLWNLKIILLLNEEANENKLREYCIEWIKVMEENVPAGWDEARLEFLKETPGWQMVLRAIAGEVPFRSLVGLPIQEPVEENADAQS